MAYLQNNSHQVLFFIYRGSYIVPICLMLYQELSDLPPSITKETTGSRDRFTKTLSGYGAGQAEKDPMGYSLYTTPWNKHIVSQHYVIFSTDVFRSFHHDVQWDSQIQSSLKSISGVFQGQRESARSHSQFSRSLCYPPL